MSNDKYSRAAAKYYHLLYNTNFYAVNTELQRKWTLAMKDLLNEVGTKRDT